MVFLICSCGMRMVLLLAHSFAYSCFAYSWNSAGTAKLVEVKGPRDKLSAYQQVWLDQLLAVGIDCEVCLVLEHKGPSAGQKRKSPNINI